MFFATEILHHPRRGRAGRVRDGLCLNLFLKERASRLRGFQLPEMKRVPLEQLALSVKRLGMGLADQVLGEALEPPGAVL